MSGKKNWPAWYFGPSGEQVLCQTQADVPKGFADTPAAFAEGADARAAPRLKDFGVTKAEGLEMLRAEGVEVDDAASAAEIAAKLAENFEPEKD